MSVVLNYSRLHQPRWFTVDLGDGDTIEILMSPPTLEQQLRALDQTQGLGYQAYAISSAICEWRGVIDEKGQVVPYTWTALNSLCTIYPSAVFELLNIRRQMLQPVTDTDRKNSPLLPAAGGEVAPVETAPAMKTLENIASSSGSSDYVAGSD